MKTIFLFILLITAAHTYGYSIGKDSLLQKGIDLYNEGEYKKSIAVLEARLATALEQNDKNVQRVIYNSLGNNYGNIGKTVEALQSFQTAISLAEELNDKKSIAKCIKNIGALYADTKDFEKALVKYKEAEKIARSINDTFTLADCANNEGVVFEQQKKYDEALKSYTTALTLYQELKMNDRIAILYNNLGIVYKYLKNYDQSIFYYQKSLAISDTLKDQFLVAANFVNMGNVYEMKGDYKKAIELNEQGLATGRKINSKELIIEALGNLAADYAKSGDYKTSTEFYKAYTATNDSFVSIERSRQMAEMQTKYETVKKEKELSKKELMIQKRNYQLFSIVGGMILLSIVVFLLYNRQQIKQKQAREKAVQAAEFNERMRIAKDVHDDLGAGLSKISLTANVAEQKILNNGNPSPDIRHIVSTSKDLIDNMRDLIWVLNPEHTTLDNLLARLREYSADYLEGMNIEVVLDFPNKVPEMRISRELQRNIFSTVKEAINNCVKHAAASEINIMVSTTNNKLSISVSDNGKGFDRNNLKGSGNGLRNMKQRIQAVGGSFSIDPQPAAGTTIIIMVPFEQLSLLVKNTTIV